MPLDHSSNSHRGRNQRLVKVLLMLRVGPATLEKSRPDIVRIANPAHSVVVGNQPNVFFIDRQPFHDSDKEEFPK